MTDLLPRLEPAEVPLVHEMSRCLAAAAIQGPLVVELSNKAAEKAQVGPTVHSCGGKNSQHVWNSLVEDSIP